ncbi:MAG: DUF2062 domain-containing protein [Betaproteobacteria bacterium]|nr:DUF2062 domain-containing protein [Betaproteobacteria bacterium]
MPRKFLRNFLPSHDSIRQHRHISRFGTFLHHPNLWHLNRDSVAGGLAIGLFSGLIPGPFQMLTAAVLAVAFRVNLPVALFTTLYTNPFTIGPLYVIAYEYGKLLTGGNGQMTQAPEFEWSQFGASIEALARWLILLGKPLALGLVALALTLAALGWVGVQAGWRAYVVIRWRRRKARRARR